MMNREELPPLKTILSNLKAIANKVRTESSFCRKMKSQLKECGYDITSRSPDAIMKVLSLAVNETIQKQVNLRNKSTMVVNQELHQLLGIREDQSIGQYFSLHSHVDSGRRPWTCTLKKARSPLDMAKHLKRTVVRQWLVKNMIQYQFKIKWNTTSPSGEPDDYTFYKLCDMKNTTELFKYKPRQAHVKATLYKECRRTRMFHQQSTTKEELCPKVYIRTTSGWRSWQADKNKFINVPDIGNDLSWINPSIRQFIKENSDEQSLENLKDTLAKPTLYWAVVHDNDFMPCTNLKLNTISQTQVYVGKANNGIRGRWIKDSDNHCEMMKKCLDNVRAMTTYDPLRLEGIQLVDARLALAKVRKEHSALFVIKTFGDEVEKAKIAQRRAEVSLDESKEDFFCTLREVQELLSNTTYNITLSLKESVRKLKKKWKELTEDFVDTNGSKLLRRVRKREALLSFEETAKTMAEGFLRQARRVPAEAFSQTGLKQLKTLRKASEYVIEKAEIVEEQQEELDQATAVANDLENPVTNKSERDKQVKESLINAEKWHRQGKRVNRPRNIIPSNVCKITWKPTDMRYGMNSN